MSDLVGARATSIMDHMNKDHENSMIAMVLHNNKQLTHPPTKAKMVSIDANGFTIEYRYVTDLFSNPSGEKKRQKITFSPAVKSASEVRQQVVALNKEAEAGIPSKYPISYSMPRDLIPWIGIFISLTLMSNPSLLASMHPQINYYLSTIRDKTLGFKVISIIWKGLVAAHAAEATAMTFYVRSRGASLATTAKWVSTHFIIGFPTYFTFQKLNPPAPKPSKKE